MLLFSPQPTLLSTASGARLTEVHFHVKLFFKKLRPQSRVTQILGSVSAGRDMQRRRTTLKGGSQIRDPLPVRMVESFRDPQNSGKPASNALVVVVQRRIRHVMSGRLGLAVVITDQRGHDGAVAPFHSRNVAVHG